MVLICGLLQLGLPPRAVDAAPVSSWNSNYSQKKAIDIQTQDALPTGYSIQVTVDHAALVTGGQSLSSGNDLRIVHWNGMTWQELDRVLAVGSSWNSSSTKIYFRTKTAIAAASTNSDYFLYYGYASAGSPPADANKVYDLFDDFNDNSINAAKWTTYGGVSETGGEMRITDTNSAGNYEGFNTLNSYGSGYTGEVSYRIATQTSGIQQNSESSIGFADMGLASAGSANKKTSVWNGSGWSALGDSNSLQGLSYAYQRVSIRYVGTTVRWYENETLVQTRFGSPNTTPFYVDFAANSTGTWDVRADDVVIRKHVGNEPTAAVVTVATPSTSWNSAYQGRQLLSVATTAALPNGYSLSATFNHAALVSRGLSLSSGNDIRVARWNGSTWAELDRVLAVGSSWNAATTKVFFRTQSAIGANTINGQYYLYYGNAAAGSPPANANNVYDVFDDFNNAAYNGSVDGSKWTRTAAPSITVVQTGGELRISGTSQSGSQYTPSKLISTATVTTDYIAESTYSVVTSNATLNGAWVGQFGPEQDTMYLDKGFLGGSLGHYASGHVSAGLTSLQSQTFSGQRIGAGIVSSSGLAREWENSGLRASRSGASIPTRSAVFAFQANVSGQTFDVRYDDIVIRKQVSQEPAVTATTATPVRPQISTGDGSSCIVAVNNVGLCWGGDGAGQLGNGATAGTQTAATLIQGGYSWSNISVGYNFACGVTTAGVGYCWGSDSIGQLGNGATTGNQTSPSPVSGGYTWASIVASRNAHACGITTGGDAYCWGSDVNGRLGDGGSDTNTVAPSLVTGSYKWATLSAGTAQTCGVTTAGVGYCWGLDSSGQLGDPTDTVSKANPALVAGGQTWQSITTGDAHSCGLNTAGTAYCWGSDSDERLGNGASGNASSPGLVSGGNTFTSIATGDYHSCGIRTDSALACWGSGAWNQIGDGDTNNESIPKAPTGSHYWDSISAGNDSTCGIIQSTGFPKCWGRNDGSEVGDGSASARSTPVDAFSNLSINATAMSDTEGNVGTKNFQVTVADATARVSPIPITVDYGTVDDTATAGSDYTTTSGTLSFSPGTATNSFNISVNGDTDLEPNEAVRVTVSNPSTGATTGSYVTATITNDDAEPNVAPNTPTALAQTKLDGTPIPGTTLYNFDANAQGWSAATAGVTLSQTTTVKRTGAGAARVEIVNGQDGWTFDGVNAPRNLSANGPTFSAWVYLPPGSTGTGWRSAFELRGADDTIYSGGYSNLTAGYWTNVTFTPPPGLTASMKYVAIYTQAAGWDATGTNSVYIDDVQQGAGIWTNEGGARFTASVSDPNTADTLALCVEAQLVGTPFTNSQTSCGSAVAVSAGSPVTVEHSLSGPAGIYHWQIRTRDTAGLYSSWVSYGGNLESDGDVGVDLTAPSAGTVRDGPVGGVDVNYNSGALDTLSGNWSGFADANSGIVRYEYSIGTAIGGTTIVNWTSVASSVTEITRGGLSLQTGVPYYFNVRATDSLGQVSSVVSSDGQTVAPTLTFNISSPQIAFDDLNANNSLTDTKSLNVTTSTNAYNGYVVRQFGNGLLTAGAKSIPAYAGTWATPTTWTGTGFGFTSNDPIIQSEGDKFGGATKYAAVAASGPGDVVADHTSTVTGTPITNQQFILTYRVTAGPLQPAGRYTAALTLGATAIY